MCDLHRNPSAHRVSNNCHGPFDFVENPRCHRFNGGVLFDISQIALTVGQGIFDRLPNATIRQEARNQDNFRFEVTFPRHPFRP